MGIPEAQLETWAHQGSIAQSSETYRIIKNALEPADSPYAEKQFEVFLQGSYGNDTNIYSESDVDIVIRLTSCFWHDLSKLPEGQKVAFKATYSDAAYGFDRFKSDVQAHLIDCYGGSVEPGDKLPVIPLRTCHPARDLIASDWPRTWSSRPAGSVR